MPRMELDHISMQARESPDRLAWFPTRIAGVIGASRPMHPHARFAWSFIVTKTAAWMLWLPKCDNEATGCPTTRMSASSTLVTRASGAGGKSPTPGADAWSPTKRFLGLLGRGGPLPKPSREWHLLPTGGSRRARPPRLPAFCPGRPNPGKPLNDHSVPENGPGR